jgi:hypothetical protein
MKLSNKSGAIFLDRNGVGNKEVGYLGNLEIEKSC